MPKILSRDNPALPVDYNNPTDEDKRKVYTFNDGDITIDSQVHIFDEIPSDEKAEKCLAAILEWFNTTEECQTRSAELAGFYTERQLFRFCRARQFNIEKAKALILENMTWREEQKPHLLAFEGEFEVHAATGKTHLRPERDHYGRPVVVIHNHYNDHPDFDVGAQLSYYTLEKSSRWMNEHVEGPSHHVIFLNMENFTYSSQPPMDIAKKVGYALSLGYPERLGNIVIYNAPWIFRAFFATVASILLDDRTYSKVVFLKESDKQLIPKMEFIFGPDWRVLTGIGGEQPDPKVAPGFDSTGYAQWCKRDDDLRFGTSTANPVVEEGTEGEVVEKSPTDNPESTPVLVVSETSTPQDKTTE